MSFDKNTNKESVFDRIAPIYGLFYDYQKRHYNAVLDAVHNELNLSTHKNIIDIGCGTGALCSVLNQRGFNVTGIDSAEKMLEIATRKQENTAIKFIQADVLEGLPFEDNSFDVSIASFVAHGLGEFERRIMYSEMNRLTKHWVIIHDYNENRSISTDIIELLERGDYFNFINKVKTELRESFHDVRILDIGSRATCYIAKIISFAFWLI